MGDGPNCSIMPDTCKSIFASSLGLSPAFFLNVCSSHDDVRIYVRPRDFFLSLYTSY